MNFLEGNLRELWGRFPDGARRVEAAPAGSGSRSRLSESESNRVAARWLGNRSWPDGSALAVSGFCDGAHVRALLGRVSKDTRIFVGEPDAASLRLALSRIDWRHELRDPRLLLGVGEIGEGFFAAMEETDVLGVRNVEALVFSPCYNAAPDYFARFFTEFARQIDFRRKLYGTATVDAELWQANTFANLRAVACAPDVAVLRNVFPGLPMVLVSAGPSLDESLKFVREVANRAIIVAVNSSYRALRNAGVVPHLVFAADPRGFTKRGFEGIPVDQTYLVTTPLVEPGVPALFDDRVFAWSGSNPLVQEIRRRCGVPAGTTLVEQGTVSACAVDLAVLMGCDRLCLVGQDLAVSPDGRSHASDTFYSDLNANQVDLEACRLLPGNTLPEVSVEEKLYVYLRTFTQLAAARPQLRWLNTSRLGAKIEGVPYGSFEEAAAWLGSADAAHVCRVLAKCHKNPAASALRFDQARAVLAPTEAFARSVLEKSLRAVSRLELLDPDDAPAKSAKNGEMFEALAMINELRAAIEAQPEDYYILKEGRLKLELHRMRVAIRDGDCERPTSQHELFEAREFAWAMAEGSWFLLSRMRALGIEGR